MLTRLRPSLIACLIFLLIPSAMAKAEPREYDIYPPTRSVKDTGLYDHIHTFIIIQALSFAGGAIITRSFVSASLATVMVGGLVGGSLATAFFLTREFEEHVMAPRRN